MEIWLFSSQCGLRWCGIALTLGSSSATPAASSHSLTIIYSGSLCFGALMTCLPSYFLPDYDLFISNTIITILQLVGLLIHFSSRPSTQQEDDFDLDKVTFTRLWIYVLCIDASKYLTLLRLFQESTSDFSEIWVFSAVIAVLYLASGVLFWSGIASCESQNEPNMFKFIFLLVATFMSLADLSFPFLSFLP